jgi:ubiquinone/menaquinone biosynthesis C-methylase UbiE
MNHADHVDLLRDGGIMPGQVWADFGAGTGAFTLAVAELLAGSGTLYAIDRDAAALRQNAAQMRERFPSITYQPITADFMGRLQLPALDGIVMANALHFTRDRKAVIRAVRQ